MEPSPDGDPRVYMAAERTFLAWMRTGIALMGFGFVVARVSPMLEGTSSPVAVPLGVALVLAGIVVNVVSAVRHLRYIRAIDAGHFRRAFGSVFALAIAGALALIGVAMAVVLTRS